jgi:hypothetical protein
LKKKRVIVYPSLKKNKSAATVNQFITVALTEKLSVMNAAEYFAEKAKKGNREKYDRVLLKVSKREPLEYDKK